ncbi:hypothetical protein ACIBG8_14180 [Nonomuraea sp. NPDC050556]|uniref:hypothetical protein n=1 Tax=Nonomuraea sp. NPDC050556 TaxID=3364369 RepID=UPI0037BB09E4
MKRLVVPLLALALYGLPALPAEAAVAPALTDTFDGARDTDPTYGLNDSLATRQSGTARGVTYTRVSGSWDTSTPPAEYYSQVNHPDHPGKMLFALGRSAVRLDAPMEGDTYTVTAVVDPDPLVRGTAADWSSVMLSRSAKSAGYVTNTDVDLGLTVARDGRVQLFRNGTAQWATPLQTTRASNGFATSVAVSGTSVTVTVNGASRTATLGSAMVRPYLYLGAYVSNAQQVSTVDNLTVSRMTRFADTFEGSTDTDPGYGLNDKLGGRQVPLNTVGYTRVSGDWATDATPQPYYSQVNHPNHPGKLIFALGRSAVRLDGAVIADSSDSYTVSAVVDPDPLLKSAPSDWSSVMLSHTAKSTGYVTNGNVEIGLTVSRDGKVQLFKSGDQQWATPMTVTRASNGFAVTIAVTGASTANPSVVVTVNGSSRTFGLGVPLAKPYLYLGAWVGNSQQVSTVDDLVISRVDPYPNVEYYGYFATRILSRWGNHIPEAKGFANMHFISISPDNPGEPYAIEDLKSCPPHSCALYAGYEFFPAECSGTCPIFPTMDRWNAFVELVKPYQDRLMGIYLKDEAQVYGVTNADLQKMASAVKASMAPGKGFGPFPIMMTLAAGDASPRTYVPDEVDWLGVDDYGADAARLDSLLTTLEKMGDRPRRTYIFPPTVVGPYTGQYDTPAKIEAVQHVYMEAARQHPSVIMVQNFGVWVEAWEGQPVTNPWQIPAIWATQERYGTAVSIKR